jgi:alkaline phosphatase D
MGILTECVGTSISSLWPEPLATPMQEALPMNPHLAFFNPIKRATCAAP